MNLVRIFEETCSTLNRKDHRIEFCRSFADFIKTSWESEQHLVYI
jgi:hypothetical protein